MDVGSRVSTPYGKGIVKEIRSDDGFVIVEPDNWLMANNRPPTFFLKADVVKVEEVSETDFSMKIITERLSRAADLKSEGALLFKDKNFEEARLKYLQALQCVQGLGDNITNEIRAMVFEMTIPCSNNAALCLLKLKKFSESLIYADNSVRLIEALEARMDGRVWVSLQERGMTKDALMKNKRKGLLLLSKAQSGMDDFDAAKTNIRAALSIIPDTETDGAEAKELNELLSQVTAKLAKQTSKQKAIWSKAFQKNSEDGVKDQQAVVETKSPFSTLLPNIMPKSFLSPPPAATTASASGNIKNNSKSKSQGSKGKKKDANTKNSTDESTPSTSTMSSILGLNRQSYLIFGALGTAAVLCIYFMRTKKS